jgi:hypothetical protein
MPIMGTVAVQRMLNVTMFVALSGGALLEAEWFDLGRATLCPCQCQ